jgi:putative NADH-flavin reductase
MKIAILGATGSTGRHFVRLALEEGHHVLTFVRNADEFSGREGLSVVVDSVDNVDAMRSAFDGCDAVVSCLGVRVSPFAMRGPIDFQQRTLPKILDAIDRAEVPRFVLMTSFGAGDTAYKASRFARHAIYHGIARGIFEDKARSEAALANRRVSWTAVYPVTLYEASATHEVALLPLEEVARVPGIPRLPYVNVAAVLLDLTADATQDHQRLLLTTQDGFVRH